MPYPFLVELTDESGHKIRGSSSRTLNGDPHAIVGYGFSHSVYVATDSFETGGVLSAYARHGPLTIDKEVDGASPVLYQNLTQFRLFSEVAVRLYCADPLGNEVHFFSIILTDAVVTEISLKSKKAFMEKNEAFRPMESVSFSYRSIQWIDELNGRETGETTFLLHDWNEEKVLRKYGILPATPEGYLGLRERPAFRSQWTASAGKNTDSPGSGEKTPSGPPASFDDAEKRLEATRQKIRAKGYSPKYSDAKLKDMAENGNVGEERFQVRFMEEKFLESHDTPGIPLSGAMGPPMAGATGKGAKYWSTSFDQIEDADTDPRLLSEKLGIAYDPESSYVLILVDREKAVPQTGVKSVSATFKNVSEFANTELPDEFPKSFTDVAMTPEFQAKYAKCHAEAVQSGALQDQWSRDTKKFEKYLKTTGLNKPEQKQLATRMRMHDKIGNNCDYVGNGLTKDLNGDSPNSFGVVETLNFERKELNLKQLSDSGAIRIIKGLKPI